MTEIEELRSEIAALRKEVAELRADRSIHHYHHQAQPALFVAPQPWSPSPLRPGYYPATCGGAIPIDGTTLFYNGHAATMGMSESGVG